jgi:hypothetical protein
MPFEFYCPEGNLLEGDDDQLGTQGRCPLCGTLFTFPKTTLIAKMMHAKGPKPKTPAEPRPGISMGDVVASHPDVIQAAAPEPQVLQVLCPRGHILDTPEEMLGTAVICPHCRVKFTPTVERSVPYLRTKQRYEAQKEESQGRFWLAIAIVAATVVIATFVVLAVYLRRSSE